LGRLCCVITDVPPQPNSHSASVLYNCYRRCLSVKACLQCSFVLCRLAHLAPTASGPINEVHQPSKVKQKPTLRPSSINPSARPVKSKQPAIKAPGQRRPKSTIDGESELNVSQSKAGVEAPREGSPSAGQSVLTQRAPHLE